MSSDQIRKVAATFHRNFSKGQFHDNAPLVAPGITVNSNTVEFAGRDAFIERIKRFETPFPGLQLQDRVLIVEDRSAAVLYVMQGVHGGPFGDHEASGHKVEVFGAELFDFNDDTQMSNLLTITRLDRLDAQVRGLVTVEEHQPVSLLATDYTHDLRRALRDHAAALYGNDDAARIQAAKALVAADSVTIVDEPESGPEPWLRQWQFWQTDADDFSVRVDRTLVDGNRLAVGYTISGLHHSGAAFQFRAVDFLEFDGPDRVTEIVTVHNPQERAAQITAR